MLPLLSVILFILLSLGILGLLPRKQTNHTHHLGHNPDDCPNKKPEQSSNHLSVANPISESLLTKSGTSPVSKQPLYREQVITVSRKSTSGVIQTSQLIRRSILTGRFVGFQE